MLLYSQCYLHLYIYTFKIIQLNVRIKCRKWVALQRICLFSTNAPVHDLSVELEACNQTVGDTKALIADVAQH